MNAADVTHGLKILGGGTRMWVGVLVLAIFFAAVCLWMDKLENRETLCRGLFG